MPTARDEPMHREAWDLAAETWQGANEAGVRTLRVKKARTT
jgi:hypothetical protein